MTTTDERFSRLELLVGEEGVAKLRRSTAAVFGLGGVGGFCVEALARSGVGRLVLADVDRVSRSNFNRQVLATEATLGEPKTAVAAARIRQINPAAVVIEKGGFFCMDSADGFFDPRPDVVVDAIDGLGPKCSLIRECLQRGIPVVTCTGSCRRLDPTKVRVAPLGATRGDPLAARVRKLLRKHGFGDALAGIPAVYSEEVPSGEEGVFAVDPAYFARGRPRMSLGSICHTVGTFGFFAASAALRSLLGPT
jgi:tRNA A37 threonylcarbamoyladenosine dehydratase